MDFVGTPTINTFAFQVLVKGCILVVVGLYGDGMELPLSFLPLKVINIRGSFVGA